MKRLTQMAKVLIMTFSLILLLCNFHHLLQAEPECWTEPQWMCERIAESNCFDICDRAEEGKTCTSVEFVYGSCMIAICYQYYDYYCDNDYWTSEYLECGPGGCPMK